jgi:hypothetical protein
MLRRRLVGLSTGLLRIVSLATLISAPPGGVIGDRSILQQLHHSASVETL